MPDFVLMGIIVVGFVLTLGGLGAIAGLVRGRKDKDKE